MVRVWKSNPPSCFLPFLSFLISVFLFLFISHFSSSCLFSYIPFYALGSGGGEFEWWEDVASGQSSPLVFSSFSPFSFSLSSVSLFSHISISFISFPCDEKWWVGNPLSFVFSLFPFSLYLSLLYCNSLVHFPCLSINLYKETWWVGNLYPFLFSSFSPLFLFPDSHLPFSLPFLYFPCFMSLNGQPPLSFVLFLFSSCFSLSLFSVLLFSCSQQPPLLFLLFLVSSCFPLPFLSIFLFSYSFPSSISLAWVKGRGEWWIPPLVFSFLPYLFHSYVFPFPLYILLFFSFPFSISIVWVMGCG